LPLFRSLVGEKHPEVVANRKSRWPASDFASGLWNILRLTLTAKRKSLVCGTGESRYSFRLLDRTFGQLDARTEPSFYPFGRQLRGARGLRFTSRASS
jgi:hypothetical protein